MRRDRAWVERDDPADASIELRHDLSPGAESELIEAEEADMVRRAIEALPAGARRALQLYRFEGHGQVEIARIMGISRSGVEKHLAVAMNHLRRSLKDCGYFGVAPSLKQEPAGGAAPNGKSKP